MSCMSHLVAFEHIIKACRTLKKEIKISIERKKTVDEMGYQF